MKIFVELIKKIFIQCSMLIRYHSTNIVIAILKETQTNTKSIIQLILIMGKTRNWQKII